MYYPKFLKENDTIGVCALSAGVGNKLEDFDNSISVLKKQGYKIKETASVRVDDQVANTPNTRAKELDQLIVDKDVDMIMCAAGGDVQLETVPYINYQHIKDNPKWLMGASDPTNLVFPVTTMLDIATLYGFNAGGYSLNNDLAQQNNLNILKGNIVTQTNFPQYISFIDLINDRNILQEVQYKSNSDIDISGRCIGGCLDVISKLIGTPYDGVNSFLEKYKDDGFIWYIDNFALSALNTYLTLTQMKMAGYFKYCKAVLIGRVAFESNIDSTLITSYEQAYQRAFSDLPYIYQMDIGHTWPAMTMINGAMIHVKHNSKGTSIDFSLE